MKIILTVLLLSISSMSAQADIVKLKCQCGEWTDFGGDHGRQFVHVGRPFLLMADEDNYYFTARRECRKRHRTLNISASCNYASER